MDKKLKNLSYEFIDRVEEAVKMIFEGLNLQSKDELLNYRNTHSGGEFNLNGINKFNFHGRGCRFENGLFKIDWELGYRDHFCGLDPFKLSVYIKNYYQDLNKYQDIEYIQQEFDEALKQGEMKRIHGLYYFSVRGHNLLK